MTDIVIVGGGVIGLLSALQLATSGGQVVLVEAGTAGSEASWAGGGIVSPLYPWRYGAAVSALAQWSQAFYPELGAMLAAQTGIDPQVYQSGLYWLDLEDDADALRWASDHHRDLRCVEIEQAYASVPELSRRFSRALYMPEVANVRNPRLLKALRKALQQMPGVRVIEKCPVSGFLREGARICGVSTAKGEVRGDEVIVAAGAWSGVLLETLGLALPVEPVKGQMILYQCAEDFLPSMVLAGGRYAIPRRDGHVLIGSTLEHVGFDKVPTQSALDSLRDSAQALLPELRDAQVAAHWAGLRPGSPDGIPYIGKVAGVEGLWLNCGHYRNGLVLAPASCHLLVDLMQGREPIIDPRPYAPAERLAAI